MLLTLHFYKTLDLIGSIFVSHAEHGVVDLDRSDVSVGAYSKFKNYMTDIRVDKDKSEVISMTDLSSVFPLAV